MTLSETQSYFQDRFTLEAAALQELGVTECTGFELSSQACLAFLAQKNPKSGLLVADEIKDFLGRVDATDPNSFMIVSFGLKKCLQGIELPENLDSELQSACQKIFEASGEERLVVYQSPSSPLANCARLSGLKALRKKIKTVFAEHFSNAVIRLSEDPDYDYLAELPQPIVQGVGDLESSGVALSFDPKSGARDFVVVYSTQGIAEDIERRPLNRDEYFFHKEALRRGVISPVYSRVGDKEFQLQFDWESMRLEHLPLSRSSMRAYSLQEAQAYKLACVVLEYEKAVGSTLALSWSNNQGDLQVLNCEKRVAPEAKSVKLYQLAGSGPLLLSGEAVGSAVASGKVRIVESREQLDDFQKGEILVARRTEPDWEPIFRKAGAIVTEGDRRVSHSSILAREMGIPAVIQAQDCQRVLQNGQLVTVSCCPESSGQVLEGRVPFEVEEFNLEKTPQLKVELMANLSLPEQALACAQLPWAGAGLIRSEFMIGGWVKVHPQALLNKSILEPEVQKAIDRLSFSFANPKDYFVGKMSQAIGLFCSAFWPRPVTLRLSDLKSNEYARLLGGESFEPKEKNSMLGWRGATRYCDPDYRQAFELELAAIKRVRQDWGFTNLRLMIPFCRTPEEGERVLNILAECGLKQGGDDLQVWVMSELPSNVFLAKEFAGLFDGLSIGSSDLTSLTLGVDRSAEKVVDCFDEFHPALLAAYEQIVVAAHNAGKKVSFCGEAASVDAELAAFLVELGVDVLSLQPDALRTTMERLS